MRRRRGETSLFEILREPEEKGRPKAAEAGGTPSRLPAASPEGEASETVAGSSESRPRLDVTPPRASRSGFPIAEAPVSEAPVSETVGGNRVSEELAALSHRAEGGRAEGGTAAHASAGDSASSTPRRGLPELAPELSSTELGTEMVSRTTPAWQRPVSIPPAILFVALIGVFLVGYLAYHAGVAATVEDYEEVGGPSDSWDPAPWQIHQSHPGEKADVQRIVDENGQPLAGAASVIETVRKDVIIVSSRRNWEDPKVQAAAEQLALYIDGFIEPHQAQLKVLGDDLIVFLGPFESGADAQSYLEGVAKKIPNKFGVKFRDAYRHSITFTPAQLEAAREGW